MPTVKKNGLVSMKQIKGKSHLYTFDNVSRDPKAEKQVVDRIIRKAKSLKTQLLVKNGF
jgi:hypothetical protein